MVRLDRLHYLSLKQQAAFGTKESTSGLWRVAPLKFCPLRARSGLGYPPAGLINILQINKLINGEQVPGIKQVLQHFMSFNILKVYR